MEINNIDTATTALHPDTERFLTHLDEGAERFRFRVIYANGGARKIDGRPEDVLRELMRANDEGAGVFVVVNAGGHTDADIRTVRAVFADLDGAPLEPVYSCALEPHMIIETSPGRWHAYWLVDGLGIDQFAGVQRAIAVRFDSDPRVFNPSRVMRAPGFYHRKAEPYLSRIIHESGGQHYTAEQILAEFPPLKAEQVPKPLALNGAGSQVIPQGGRNNHLASLAGTMRRRDMSEASILAALTAENARCDPPLPLDEVNTIARSVARYAPGGNGHGGNVVAFVPSPMPAVIAELTDAGNADRFVAQHGDNVRYNEQFGWMAWTGTHWARDNLAVSPLMVATAISIHAEAASCPDPDGQKHITKWAIRSQMANSVKAALWIARSLVVAPSDIFDAQPLALTVANGTLDLRTGALGPHRREDYATRCVDIEYDTDALCPTWDAFLARILPGQLEREFIQRAIGYSLTGSTTEQVLFFLYGHGANGKTVLVETLRSLLGGYQSALDAETLMINPQGRASGSIATLVGARVAAVPETPEGGRLNEVRIKELTGGDTVGARFLYKEAFDFKPQFKLWIRGNHKPQIRGTDDGIWRRFALIHLGIQIPEAERDAGLQAKLLAELPGILAWAVRGAVEWYRGGLRIPDSVRGAVAEYRSEMDTLGDFLAEMCEIGPRCKCAHKAIYTAYKQWCDEAGMRSLSSKWLGRTLEERGFAKSTPNYGVAWDGIGLREDGWNV